MNGAHQVQLAAVDAGISLKSIVRDSSKRAAFCNELKAFVQVHRPLLIDADSPDRLGLTCLSVNINDDSGQPHIVFGDVEGSWTE